MCEVRVQLHCFACRHPVAPAWFVEETILSVVQFWKLVGESVLLNNYILLFFQLLIHVCLLYLSLQEPFKKGDLLVLCLVFYVRAKWFSGWKERAKDFSSFWPRKISNLFKRQFAMFLNIKLIRQSLLSRCHSIMGEPAHLVATRYTWLLSTCDRLSLRFAVGVKYILNFKGLMQKEGQPSC